MTTPVAEISGLKVYAPNGQRTLGPVRETLLPGILGVVGCSGMGKSTLLRALVGRIPSGWRVQGRIRARGQVLGKNQGLPGAALVSQDAQSALDPVARVDRLLRWAAGGATAGLERARATLAELDLDFDEIGRCRAAELSGGMQQRVLVAMGLLRARDFLLLDEPGSALDSGNTLRVVTAAQRWRAKAMDRVVIHVSHDLTSLKQHADLIWLLKDGRISEVVDAAAFDAPLTTPAGRHFEHCLRRLTA